MDESRRAYIVVSPGAAEWRWDRSEAEREFKLQSSLYHGREVALYSADLPVAIATADPDGAAVEHCEKEIATGRASLLAGEPFDY